MRFRSLLLTIILLIVFSGNAYATKPREAGIGIKYGYTLDNTRLNGTAKNDKNLYINHEILKMLIIRVQHKF